MKRFVNTFVLALLVGAGGFTAPAWAQTLADSLECSSRSVHLFPEPGEFPGLFYIDNRDPQTLETHNRMTVVGVKGSFNGVVYPILFIGAFNLTNYPIDHVVKGEEDSVSVVPMKLDRNKADLVLIPDEPPTGKSFPTHEDRDFLRGYVPSPSEEVLLLSYGDSLSLEVTKLSGCGGPEVFDLPGWCVVREGVLGEPSFRSGIAYIFSEGKWVVVGHARGAHSWGSLEDPCYTAILIEDFLLEAVRVGTEGSSSVPASFTLSQNYPNPFNPSTQIEFTLKESGYATLRVYDMLGREVDQLVQEDLPAGTYTATFEAHDLASGTYLYVLQFGVQRLAGKMLLVK